MRPTLTRQNTLIGALVLGSFVLRLWVAFHLEASGDVLRILNQAMDFYRTGILSPVGAKVVYSGESLPGSLQDILVGLPLFLSSGRVWGTLAALAALATAAQYGIFRFYRSLFPQAHALTLAFIILYAPWSFFFCVLWNPTYAMIAMVPFFWAVASWSKTDSPRTAWPSFWLGFTPIAVLQLHLSFVIPGALAFWLAWKVRNRIRARDIWAVIGGAAVATLPLIPYFIAKAHGSLPEGVSGDERFILSHIRFAPLDAIPQAFSRFWTFASADVFRFVGQGAGYLGALRKTLNSPTLTFASVIVLAQTIGVFGLSLNRFVQTLRRWKTSNAIDRLWVGVPSFTAALFLFSIKGPSAHTLWILFPLAFVPLADLRIFSNDSSAAARARAFALGILLPWACAMILGFGAYLLGVPNPIGATQPS